MNNIFYYSAKSTYVSFFVLNVNNQRFNLLVLKFAL